MTLPHRNRIEKLFKITFLAQKVEKMRVFLKKIYVHFAEVILNNKFYTVFGRFYASERGERVCADCTNFELLFLQLYKLHRGVLAQIARL